MDYSNFRMSEKQVQEFAKAVFADIAAYVEEHQKEYEEFLKSEKGLDMKDEQKALKSYFDIFGQAVRSDIKYKIERGD